MLNSNDSKVPVAGESSLAVRFAIVVCATLAALAAAFAMASQANAETIHPVYGISSGSSEEPNPVVGIVDGHPRQTATGADTRWAPMNMGGGAAAPFTDQWIEVDLKYPKLFDSLRMTIFNGATRNWPIVITAGNSPAPTDVVFTGSLPASGTNGVATSVSFTATTARYVRVRATGPSTGGVSQFFGGTDLKIVDSAGAAALPCVYEWSDEFTGTSLDAKWDTHSTTNPANYTFTDGKVNVPGATGEIDVAATGPINLFGLDIAELDAETNGNWQVETEYTATFTDTAAPYGWNASGLMLWQSDANFIRYGIVRNTDNGSVLAEAAKDRPTVADPAGARTQSASNPTIAGNAANQPPVRVRVRMARAGTNVIAAAHSVYNAGTSTWGDWVSIGHQITGQPNPITTGFRMTGGLDAVPTEPAPAAGTPSRLAAGSILGFYEGGAPTANLPSYAVEYIRVTPEPNADCGDAPVDDCFTQSDQFNGSALDAKWAFRWGGAATPPAVPTVSGGNLNLQMGTGEIDGASTGPIGFIGQPLPATGDFVIEGKFTGDIAGDVTGTPRYAQAGLSIYQTNGNFVKTGHVRTGEFSLPEGRTYWEAGRETNGAITRSGNVAIGTTNPATWWSRITRVGTALTYDYSIDGTTWNPIAISGGTNIDTVMPPANGTRYFGPYGALGSNTIQVDYITITPDPEICGDVTPPESTHAMNPAAPNHPNGTSWLPGVTLSISATDNESTPANITRQYSLDNGTTWLPYTAPVAFDNPGSYSVRYRSIDEANNVESPSKVATFNVANPPTGECVEYSDEFDGDTLNDKWAFRWDSTDPVVSAQRPPAPTVSGGNMNMIAGPGEFHPNGNGAAGYVGQEIPEGDWTIDMKFSAPNLVTAETPTPIQYTQAGLMLYQTDGDFVKVVKIQRENLANSYWESTSRNNMGALTTVGNWGDASAAITAIDPFWFRMVKTGNTVQVYRAIADPVGNPSNWIQTDISTAGYNLATIFAEADGPVYFGPTGMLGNTAFQVDYVRVTPDEDCPEPPPCVAMSDEFDGDTLNDKWAFRWDSTDPVVSAARPALPTVAGGNLVAPMGSSELNATNSGPIQFIGQELPEGDWTIETKINGPNVSGVADTIAYTQAGLLVYQNDANFIKLVKIQTNDEIASGAAGANRAFWESAVRNNGAAPAAANAWPGDNAVSQASTWWMRIVKTGNNVSTYYATADPTSSPANWLQTNIVGSGASLQPYNFSGTFDEADGPVYFGPTGMLGANNVEYEYIRVTPNGCPDPEPGEGTPTSTHVFNPVAPNAPGGGEWLPGVSLALSATDEESAPANIDIEYSTNAGTTWLPYSVPLVFNTNGTYTIHYRATDEDDNTEDPPNVVTFTVGPGTENCGTGGMSDEFDGSSVDPKWNFRWGGVATPPAIPTVNGGNLVLPYGSSELTATATGPIALIGQEVPAGDFTIVAKIDASSIMAPDPGGDIAYTQGGMMLYQDDQNFIKLIKIQGGNNGLSATDAFWESGSRNNGTIANTNHWPGTAAAGSANPMWLRFTKTGANVQVHYAATDPTSNPGAWTQENISAAGYNFNTIFAPADGPVKFGPVGMLGASNLLIDYIRITPDSTGGGECQPAQLNLTVPPATGSNSWFTNSPVQATVNLVNPGHITNVQYRLGNSGAWTEWTSGTIPVAPNGANVLNAQALNGLGAVVASASVNVSIDTVNPTVTHTLNPATGPYTGPVQLTLNATDATSGIASREYRVNGGAWTAYTAPATISGAGAKVVEYRATDNAGRVSTTGSVSFTITGGGSCTPASDDFSGASINESRWTFRHPTTTSDRLAVSGGTLKMGLSALELDNAATGPITIMGQPMPTGDWTATAKFSGEQHLDATGTNGYAKSGLVLYRNDGNMIGMSRIRVGGTGGNAGLSYYQISRETNDTATNSTQATWRDTAAARFPNTWWLRLVKTGDTITGAYTHDDPSGTPTWTEVTQTTMPNITTHLQGTEPIQLGVLGANGSLILDVDDFKVTPDCDPTPEPCTAQLSDEFNGSSLDNKWSFRWGGAATPPAVPTVSGGNLHLQLSSGELDNASTGPLSFIGQPLPEGDFTIEGKFSGDLAADNTVDPQYAQLGLMLYQDDDHFVKVAHTRNGTFGGAEEGQTYYENGVEIGGAITRSPALGMSPENPTTWWIRIVNAGGNLTYQYSQDGTTFTDISNAASSNISDIMPGAAPRYFGPYGAIGSMTFDVDYIRVVPDCETEPPCTRLGDDFDGTSLDANRWTVLRPNATLPYTVGGGELRMPITEDGLYAGGNDATNIITTPLPGGQTSVTAKITADALNENYQQAGLRVYADDDNWASAHMVQFGGGASRQFEFIWESNGTPRNTPEDNSGVLDDATPLSYWVRIVSDGSNLTAFYSLDGTTFTPVGQPGSLATFVNPRIGPTAVAGTATEGNPIVRFDSITFDPDCTPGGGGDQVKPTTTRTIAPAAPDGDSGWYRSPVTVTLNASDNAGGSGVKQIEHRPGSTGTFNIVPGSSAMFTVNQQGQNLIQYRATDNANNVENTRTFDNIWIDGVAPTTGGLLGGLLGGDSYQSAVTVTLTPEDNTNGSGVLSSEYSLDGGANWVPYDGPIVVAAAGEHTVSFRSKDVAGNVEATKTLDFEIAEGYDGGDVGAEFDIVGDLVLNLDPPAGSNVATIQYRVTSIPGIPSNQWDVYEPGTPLTISEPGRYRVDYRYINDAGDIASINTLYFNVAARPPAPARLTIKSSPKKLNLPSSRRSAVLTVTVKNEGELASNQIRLCASFPSNLVRVQGSNCRNISALGAGVNFKQKFKLKLRPNLRGNRANVRFTISSPSHPNRKVVVSVRQQR